MDSITQFFHPIMPYLQIELLQLGTHVITVLTLVELSILTAAVLWLAPRLNVLLLKNVAPKVKKLDKFLLTLLIRVGRVALVLMGIWIVLHVVGLDDWVGAQIHAGYSLIQGILDLKLCKIGNSQLTLLSLLYILALSFLLVRFTGQLRNILVSRYLVKTKMDVGARQAFASAVQYGVLFIGFVILLQTAGIDLSAMTVMLGALSIGLSFGLQTITNNLVSGIIILFERPIKIGDQVQIGDVTGEVVDISLRATTVMTSNNIAIVVPNSQFVSSNVVNCTYNGRSVGIKCSLTFPASMAPEAVRELLLEVANSNQSVVKTPPPVVSFDNFSKDNLSFSLRVWTDIKNRETLPSELNFEVANRLKAIELEKKAREAAEKEAAEKQALEREAESANNSAKISAESHEALPGKLPEDSEVSKTSIGSPQNELKPSAVPPPVSPSIQTQKQPGSLQ